MGNANKSAMKGMNQMKEELKTAAGCLMVALLVVSALGCASSMSGDVYSRQDAQKVQTVEEGEVVMVREVLIEGTKSGLGTIAGGILGGALGSAIGSGSGRTIATAGGAVLGALGGSGVEEASTRQAGLEITVQLRSGEVVSIVQAADQPFQVGDFVKVLRRPGGVARVIQ